MFLVTGLLDRLLFAAGLIVFLQLPQFVDLYAQRLGGYRQAVADSVADYQHSADDHYGGDLVMMIHDFRSDTNPAQRDMGDKMQRDRERLSELDRGVTVLEGDSLTSKLIYLLGNLDRPIAKATLDSYTPGLPLSLDALICGLLGALATSGLFNLLVWPLRRRRHRDPVARGPFGSGA